MLACRAIVLSVNAAIIVPVRLIIYSLFYARKQLFVVPCAASIKTMKPSAVATNCKKIVLLRIRGVIERNCWIRMCSSYFCGHKCSGHSFFVLGPVIGFACQLSCSAINWSEIIVARATVDENSWRHVLHRCWCVFDLISQILSLQNRNDSQSTNTKHNATQRERCR